MLEQTTGPNLTREERALLCCRLARKLENTGDFAAAREALGYLWDGLGERPDVGGLCESTAAEVLLLAGVLTGRLGSATQAGEAQESGKDLLSESLSKFEALGDAGKVAEAQTELGLCYWREGAFDEARVLLQEALSALADDAVDLKALAALRLAMVENASFRLGDASRVLAGAAPLFEKSDNHILKGSFHNEHALVLRRLGEAERLGEYVDRALIEYAAASFHFERAGHTRYQACVENNLGFLFSAIGRFEDAHDHLDRARSLMASWNDLAHLAQVDETRARVLLAEGKTAEAERLARKAAGVLEGGGEQSLLAATLTTLGVALARTGREGKARMTLQRAVDVAERAGDAEGAGQAALTVIEELCDSLAPEELRDVYERADVLLGASCHPASQERLIRCARRVILRAAEMSGPPAWENFSFEREVRDYEGRLIERALSESDGVIARAARMLGVKQRRLSHILHKRHKRLRAALAQPERRRALAHEADRRAASILYAEDCREVSGALSEMLEYEGWSVEVFATGAEAAEVLRGEEHFDILVFDHDLPGLTGLELTRLARSLAHRRRTPIIFFTASELEQEARRAGADAFLRKPHDVFAVAETVARLLEDDFDSAH